MRTEDSARDEQPSREEKSPPHATDPGESPIDWEQAYLTVGDDKHLLAELMGVYVSEVDTLMRSLDRYAVDKDRSTLHRVAHTLKGASLSVGALVTSRVAESLESSARQASDSEILEWIERVKSTARLAVEAIRQHTEEEKQNHDAS